MWLLVCILTGDIDVDHVTTCLHPDRWYRCRSCDYLFVSWQVISIWIMWLLACTLTGDIDVGDIDVDHVTSCLYLDRWYRRRCGAFDHSCSGVWSAQPVTRCSTTDPTTTSIPAAGTESTHCEPGNEIVTELSKMASPHTLISEFCIVPTWDCRFSLFHCLAISESSSPK